MIQTTWSDGKLAVYETGRICIERASRPILDDELLLPRFVPPFINRSDPSNDRAEGIAPELEDGQLRDEGMRQGRHWYRLSGLMRHPLHLEQRFLYEALFSTGSHPLMDVEYVRLRTLDGGVWLTHWEHHIHLSDCRAALFEGLAGPVPAPIFDLVLLHSARAPVLSAQVSDVWVLLHSPDLETYKQGALTLRVDPTTPDVHHFSVHRIQPDWAYSGAIHETFEPIELAPGAGLSSRFSVDIQTYQPEFETLVAVSTKIPEYSKHTAQIRRTWGKSCRRNVASRIREKIELFTIPRGRFAGLHYGGFCHLNRRHLEAPVNRAEYAEYMLNEYFRCGDSWWLERVLWFARTHLDVMFFNAEDTNHGGVRHRGCADIVNPVRSCRSASLFLSLYELTGDALYREAAIANGDYILRHADAAQSRRAVSCPELAILWKQTGETRFAEGAIEIARWVARYQKEEGYWHQWYDTSGRPGRSRQYEACEYREFAPIKPEIATYNILGLLGMVEVLPLDIAKITARRALDWMLSVQSEEGGWCFPTYKSKGLWGHGAFQDALAMFQGYAHFKDERYLRAGRRVFEWAAHLLETRSYIPTVVGVWPHEMSEASLTYFYGLETLALLEEIG